ncbi:unnamed protein product [Nesidiocoris tenuis]|uniref:Uncharacterized protein n=1 Tax=Nesidiocoris tenuis TaxID=355587 RepID=A0A6H5GXY2_9HEMI|nr:unnamed protein product [Nesidiocoris tenuis]
MNLCNQSGCQHPLKICSSTFFYAETNETIVVAVASTGFIAVYRSSSEVYLLQKYKNILFHTTLHSRAILMNGIVSRRLGANSQQVYGQTCRHASHRPTLARMRLPGCAYQRFVDRCPARPTCLHLHKKEKNPSHIHGKTGQECQLSNGLPIYRKRWPFWVWVPAGEEGRRGCSTWCPDVRLMARIVTGGAAVADLPKGLDLASSSTLRTCHWAHPFIPSYWLEHRFSDRSYRTEETHWPVLYELGDRTITDKNVCTDGQQAQDVTPTSESDPRALLLGQRPEIPHYGGPTFARYG